jgi:hypothetical protein
MMYDSDEKGSGFVYRVLRILNFLFQYLSIVS